MPAQEEIVQQPIPETEATPVPPVSSPPSHTLKKITIAFAVIIVVTVLAAGALLFFKNNQKPLVVKVVASFPEGVNSGKSSMQGVRLAFEQAAQTSQYKLQLIERNDSGATGAWDPKIEEENARLAAADPAVVAYVGPQNSGASKISMPILNEAGITQISDDNTWPGLTKVGFAPGEPGIFYPTGIRHYFRVVTTDDLQGPAGAIWAESLGYKKIYILDDGEAYGKGVSDLFRSKAEDLKLQILVQETIDKKASDFTVLVQKIQKANPDMVYLGGTIGNGYAIIVKQLRNAGYKGGLMGPDGIQDNTLIERAGAQSEGVYTTAVGIPITNLGNARAEKFFKDYAATYGSEPEITGGLAYEAANIVIDAIKRGGTSRADVLKAMKDTENFNSMFGPLSFDENGDVTQKVISASVIKNRKFQFLKKLTP